VVNYRIAKLKELTDQQVRFAPPARRLEQLSRAERLLAEIDSQKHYPYQFVCYRITEYRPEAHGDLVISGQDLEHDLYVLIKDLVKSLPAMPVEEVAEPVVTLEQVSKRLNVSVKTINRWREQGLVGARPILRNGKRQMGFVESMVDRFLAANPERVRRGGRFSHLSDGEREDILRRAKVFARRSDGNFTEITRRIARRLGRSPETVRYTIKNFDRDNPAQALFPKVDGPLDPETKEIIYSSYRRGISVDTLARKFGRTRNSMYRVLNESRAQHLLDQPLGWISHPSFDDPDLEAEILAPMPDLEAFEAKQREMKAPKDVPPELSALYETPLLNKDQEQHLFRQMNYLKYKAGKLRKALDPGRARIQDIEAIEELQEEANKVKDQLINANMRLVVSIA